MNSNSGIKPKYAIMSTTPLTPSSSRGKDLCDFWRRKKGVGDTSYHSARETATTQKLHTKLTQRASSYGLRTQLCLGPTGEPGQSQPYRCVMKC